MKHKILVKTDNFEKALLRRGMTNQQLAYMLEIHPSYLSQIKHNLRSKESGVSKVMRDKMLSFLQVEFDEIFVVKKNPSQNGKRKKLVRR